MYVAPKALRTQVEITQMAVISVSIVRFFFFLAGEKAIFEAVERSLAGVATPLRFVSSVYLPRINLA